MHSEESMKNKTSTMIVVAVVSIAFATVVVASSLSNSKGASHTMPDGGSMKGDDMP